MLTRRGEQAKVQPLDLAARIARPGAALRGAVFDIQSYCLYDGPGIRTTVFLRGCPLRCGWCHNPEAWSPTTATSRTAARTARVRQLTVDEVLTEVLADREFFVDSGGGVTFSGGEPTVQHDFLLAALGDLRARGVHTAIETCGDFPAELLEPLAACTDHVLYDLKHADSSRHSDGTGAGNERIQQNFRVLLDFVGPRRLTPRVPVIPGFNADVNSAAAIARFLRAEGYVGSVHLMPYHALARSAYEELGVAERFQDRGPLSPAALSSVESIFMDAGFAPQTFG